MISRLFKLEPAAVGATALAVYAAARMLYGAFVTHDVALDGDVLVAAAGAVWQLYTRVRVTPVAKPKDANGVRLVPVDQTPRRGI
jgi:hypothetical protein